ncbi:hypothetical protein EYF80_013828 [Liparis tanakae]|uniref:Uncharacterized protein n=1 Tax=Liparis tanakae TaxID=230148 RepID=A0A4Z2ID03_9TELE|nr:hypothetical protein EYF80_013828 [Liparis tanakae]
MSPRGVQTPPLQSRQAADNIQKHGVTQLFLILDGPKCTERIPGPVRYLPPRYLSVPHPVSEGTSSKELQLQPAFHLSTQSGGGQTEEGKMKRSREEEEEDDDDDTERSR